MKPFSLTIQLAIISLFFYQSALYATTLTVKEQQSMETLKQWATTSNLAYEIDESLTTEVGARFVGTEGDKKAVIWAVDKMQRLGFDKVWTEAVDAKLWERGEASVSVISPIKTSLQIIALGGSVGTPTQGIKAPIVHFESLQALQQAPKETVVGKLVFISQRMKRHKDGRGYGQVVGARVSGASEASKKGAVGLLIRSIGTDDNRLGHTGIMIYDEGIPQIPAAALTNPDADLLLNILKRGEATLHYTQTSARHDQTIIKTANVIGEITGREFPEQVVIMGSHLDSWDVGTGAVDDGIGVSITMAAASHIARLPQRPKRTIRVILFAGEEVGLLGAKAYLKQYKDQLDQHIIGAEWDFGTGYIYKMTPGVGPSALNATRELAHHLSPLGVALSHNNDAKGHSDISVLGNAGMPAINFSADGLNYFDYHHTENDTLDKVDPKAMQQNTAVYALFSYFAANSGVDFRQ